MPSPSHCQERDGCVNVLKSYQLDAGVDALLKENLAEVCIYSLTYFPPETRGREPMGTSLEPRLP